MKNPFFEILKGSVLINDSALKNWKFIFFLSVLAIIMITSSHRADKKTEQILELTKEVKILKNKFVEIHSEMQKRRLKKNVLKELQDREIYLNDQITRKIIVEVAVSK